MPKNFLVVLFLILSPHWAGANENCPSKLAPIEHKLAACLTSQPGPFVIQVQVHYTARQIILTKLLNLSLFFKPATAVQKCLSQAANLELPTKMTSELKPGTNWEFIKRSFKAKLEVSSENFCTNENEELNLENAEPLRDFPFPAGAAIESDQLYQQLIKCQQWLPSKLKQNVYLGTAQFSFFSNRGKQQLTDLEVRLPDLDKKYSQCLTTTLTPQFKNNANFLGVSKIVVDGEEQTMQAQAFKRMSYFVVTDPKSKPRHYLVPPLK